MSGKDASWTDREPSPSCVGTESYGERVEIRFYVDSDGDAHIHSHGIQEHEVAEAFENVLEDGAGRDEAKALWALRRRLRR